METSLENQHTATPAHRHPNTPPPQHTASHSPSYSMLIAEVRERFFCAFLRF